MKNFSLKLSTLMAASLLAACGGTSPSAVTTNNISTTVESSVVLLAGESVTIQATSRSSPAPITGMIWSAIKLGGSNDLVLANNDCAQKSVNSNGSTLDPTSVWTCPLQVTAPSLVSSDINFKVTVSTTDNKNNTTSKDISVTVKPNNSPPAVPSITGASSIDAGKTSEFKCSAVGGTTTKSGKYAYQWVVKDSAGISNVRLASTTSNPDVATLTGPAVSFSKDLTISCRVTDDFNKTGVVDKVVTVNPIATPTLISVIDDNISFPAGASAQLDGSQSTWYSSSVGILDPQPPIFYHWSQKQGSSVVISNPNSSRPTVSFPLKSSSNGDKRETYIFTLQVSDRPFVNGVSSGKVSTTEGVYFLNYVTPITVTVPTVTPVKSNGLASASVNATGHTGQAIYYSWTQISGPSVTLAGWNTSTVSFLAPVNPGPNSIGIILRVSMDYAPITTTNTGSSFVDVLIPVTQ